MRPRNAKIKIVLPKRKNSSDFEKKERNNYFELPMGSCNCVKLG